MNPDPLPPMSDPRREILEALAVDDITVDEALATLDINDRIQEPGTSGVFYRAAPRAATEPLTRERLAAALHERYAAALCLDPEGPHTWPCAAFSQWMDDAASILEALATPTSAPEPGS